MTYGHRGRLPLDRSSKVARNRSFFSPEGRSSLPGTNVFDLRTAAACYYFIQYVHHSHFPLLGSLGDADEMLAEMKRLKNVGGPGITKTLRTRTQPIAQLYVDENMPDVYAIQTVRRASAASASGKCVMIHFISHTLHTYNTHTHEPHTRTHSRSHIHAHARTHVRAGADPAPVAVERAASAGCVPTSRRSSRNSRASRRRGSRNSLSPPPRQEAPVDNTVSDTHAGVHTFTYTRADLRYFWISDAIQYLKT